MERYVFDIHTDGGVKQALVEAGGDCYAVSLNGRPMGTLWRDEEVGLRWNTHEEELTPYLWNISAKLSEAFSRQGFSSILQGAYLEIIHVEWKGAETLKVIMSKRPIWRFFQLF